MRKTLLTGFLGALLLAGCGSSDLTAKYAATFSAVDQEKAHELVESVERVIIRKLVATGVDQNDVRVDVVPTGQGGANVTVHVKDANELEAAQALIAEHLTFDIRIEKEEKPDGEEKPDNWIPTSLTGSSLLWVSAIGNRETGEISVELQFNEEGKKELQDVFTAAKGKNIGIFVRNLLVSKLRVAASPPSDRVVIGGIPNERVAEVFADDVNVGLRVTFLPLH